MFSCFFLICPKISNLQQKNGKFSKNTLWKIFLKTSIYTGHIPASFEHIMQFIFKFIGENSIFELSTEF